MSDLHATTAPDRADAAEVDARYLAHLIDDVTTRAKAVTDCYEASDGNMDTHAADDLVNQLRNAVADARRYASLP